MRYRDIFEGVSSSNIESLTAYLITVAESYQRAPLYDPSAEKAWSALNRSTTEKLMKRLLGSSSIDVEYSHDDPYSRYSPEPMEQIKFMLYDMVVNHHLIVFTGSSEHPIFSEEENVAFRAVHDFYAHGKIRKSFFEQLTHAAKEMGLRKLPSIDKARDLLARVNMSKFGNRGFLFNGRGELNAAAVHIRLAPAEAAPALFCEIIGQVGYQIITGSFGEQKVAILKGFDYHHLGKCIKGSPQDMRMAEILSVIASGAETLDSSLGVINIREAITRVKSGF